MNINPVNIANYGVGNNYQNNIPLEEKDEDEKTLLPSQQATREVDEKEIYDAMALFGNLNRVNFGGEKKALEINPRDYLDEESIARIENMMGEFDSGVEAFANAFSSEFGDSIPQSEIYSLAAKAYAKE